MNEQEHAPQKDQLHPPTLEEQLRAKLNGIMLATAYNPDLFDIRSKRLADVRYPPDLILMSTSYSSRGGIILDCVQNAGLNESTLEARAQEIDQLVVGLHPTSSEIQESPNDPGKIRALYTRADVMQDLRLTSFLMDKMVTKIWLSLSDEQFAYFLNRLEQKQLSDCLTSDKEMVRLHADAYRFKVNPTYIPPDAPSEFSTRETFIDLCSGNEYGDIRLDIDIPSIFGALYKKYPQG